MPQLDETKRNAIAEALASGDQEAAQALLAGYEGPWTEKLLDVTSQPSGFLGGLGEAWEGFVEKPTKFIPFAGAGIEAYDLWNLRESALRMRDGSASQEDLDRVYSFLIEANRTDRGWSHLVGSIVGELPAFALEIGLTGGAFTAGKKTAVKLLGEGIERAVSETVADAGRLGVKKALGETLGTLAGSAAQTAAIPTRVLEQTFQQMLPEFELTREQSGRLAVLTSATAPDFWEALPVGARRAWAELFSERTGGALQGIPGVAKLQMAMAKLISKHVPPSALDDTMKRLAKAGGWHGWLGELGEERVNDTLSALFGDVSWAEAYPDAERLSAEAVAFAVPGAARGAANLAGTLGRPQAPGAIEDVQPEAAEEAEWLRRLIELTQQALGEEQDPDVRESYERDLKGYQDRLAELEPDVPRETEAPIEPEEKPQEPAPVEAEAQEVPPEPPPVEEVPAEPPASSTEEVDAKGAELASQLEAVRIAAEPSDKERLTGPSSETEHARALEHALEVFQKALARNPDDVAAAEKRALGAQGAYLRELERGAHGGFEGAVGFDLIRGWASYVRGEGPRPELPELAPAPEAEKAKPARVLKPAKSQEIEIPGMETPPDVLPEARTGEAFEVEVFHGFGRERPETAYASADLGPTLGPARYSSLTEKSAREYGPEVLRHVVEAKNPYVINTAEDLTRLWGGDPIPYTPEEAKPLLQRARKELERLGHDVVVVNVPQYTDLPIGGGKGHIKRLREVFGESQVVELGKRFGKEGARAVAEEKAAPAPSKEKPQVQGPAEPLAETDEPKTPPAKEPSELAAKSVPALRKAAKRVREKAQVELEREREENTPRRARMAEGIRQRARAELQAADTMEQIADALERGESPELAGIRNAAQVRQLRNLLSLARGEPKDVQFPFPRVHPAHVKSAIEEAAGKKGIAQIRETLRPELRQHGDRYVQPSEIQALRDLLPLVTGHNADSIKEALADYDRAAKLLEPLGVHPQHFQSALEQLMVGFKPLLAPAGREAEFRRMERDLLGQKIPGFFPTPRALSEQAVEAAQIEPGMRVLEPSAGKGDMADVIAGMEPDVDLVVGEINPTLRELLKARGFTPAFSDFLGWEAQRKFDRVVMNPPFEKAAEIDHVRHAFDQLKPGGRLVSIMSAGPFGRADRKSVEFRQWVEGHGSWEKLEEGAFSTKETFRKTGVQVVLVVVDKPAAEERADEPEEGAEPAVDESELALRQGTLELSDGRSLIVSYAFREASELVPSHDARRGFEPNPGGDKNERDYADPTEGRPYRETVEKIAAAPKPQLLVTDTPSPVDGPPVVTPDLVVLGGNARTMAMQLAYSRGGEAAGRIREAMLAVAQLAGMEEAVSNLKEPVLVRVVSAEDAGPRGELSRILNESLTTGRTANTEAVSRGSRIDEATARTVARIIGDDSLSKVLSDQRRATELLSALRAVGAFTEAEVTGMLDNRGLPTAAAKDDITQTLLGAVVQDLRSLAELAAGHRQTLLRALPSLIGIRNAWPDFAELLQNSLRGLADLRQSGQSLQDALQQSTMVPEFWKEDARAVALLARMLKGPPTTFARELAELAGEVSSIAGGQATMFGSGAESPADAFDAAFGTGSHGEGASGVLGYPGRGPTQAGSDTVPVVVNQQKIGGGLVGNLIVPEQPLPGKPVNQPQIIFALEQILRVLGNQTPIRSGRMRGRKYLGYFMVQPEVIRIRTANDTATAAHEVGHALEKAVFGWVKGSPWVKPTAGKKMQAELVQMGKDLYGNDKPAGGYKREGWAEFVRMVLSEDGTAQQKAPTVWAWFHDEFLPARPAVREQFTQARALFDRWRSQGSQQRARASILRETSLEQRLKRAKTGLAKMFSPEELWESGHALGLLTKEAERLMGRQLPESSDPYLTMQSLRLTHTGRTLTMIRDGMIDTAGNITGPSLAQIRGLVGNRYRDFVVYLWARRAKALWEDPKGSRNPGLSYQDTLQILEELGSTKFELAAGQLYEWQDSLLNYAAQSSTQFYEVVKAIRKRDPGSYIPLKREFDELDERIKKMTTTEGGGLVRRLKGSGRRILDPFPEIVAQAETLVLKSHQAHVFEQIFALRGIEGLGWMIEELPTPKVPVNVPGGQAWRQVRQVLLQHSEGLGAGLQEVLETIDSMEMAGDSLFDQAMTFFVPKTWDNSGEPVFGRIVDGRVRFYQLNARLYEGLVSMGPGQLQIQSRLLAVGWGALRLQAKAFRLGTTGLRASFSLVTNPLRDIQTLWINTQSSANAVQIARAALAELAKAFFSAASGGLYGGSYYNKLLNRLGAQMATPLGQDMAAAERQARRIFAGRPVQLLHPGNWYDVVREFLQFPETAARAAEIRLLMQELGWEPGTQLTASQSQFLLLAAKQVTTDFTASGNFARTMNQVVPFFNASIQGPRAHARALARRPHLFAARMLYLAGLSLGLWWLMKDEDWYEEMPLRERFLNWHVPFDFNGRPGLIRIPRPFEVGALVPAFVEAAMDAAYRQDPSTLVGWLGHVFEVASPDFAPPILQEAGEQLANRDFFFDMPIVPQGEAGLFPEEQYNEYTSRAAIFLGRQLGVSPRRVDHAIQGFFGGVGRDIMQLSGRGADERQSEGEPADVPIFGRLFQRGGQMGSRPRSVNRLYDRLEEATRIQRSRVQEETREQRQYRLMLDDAAKACSALFFVRGHTTEASRREEITAEIAAIARDAVQGERSPAEFERLRRRAELEETRVKRRIEQERRP